MNPLTSLMGMMRGKPKDKKKDDSQIKKSSSITPDAKGDGKDENG